MADRLNGRPLLRTPGRQRELRLELFIADAAVQSRVRLVLSQTDDSGQDSHRTLEGVLRPVMGRAHLTVPSRAPNLPSGVWKLSALLDGEPGPALTLCDVVVSPRGRIHLDPALPEVDAAIMDKATSERRKAAVKRRKAALLRVPRAVRRRVVRRLSASRSSKGPSPNRPNGSSA